MDDAAQIKQNVANFAYRDQSRWDELRDLFQPDGTIAVTWYTGPIHGFIEGSKKMMAAGRAKTKHWIGASRVTVKGDRAICDTDVIIMARSKLAGVEIDITSGRASSIDSNAAPIAFGASHAASRCSRRIASIR
jgi:hypothetical protein